MVQRLLGDPNVQVVLFSGPEPEAIDTPDERAALWARIEPVMGGAKVENPYSDFRSYLFRDDDGRVLLAIEEYC